MKELYEFINKRIEHIENSATSSMGLGRILELNIIKFKVE